jgi:uncharacterized protein with HEPN domain
MASLRVLKKKLDKFRNKFPNEFAKPLNVVSDKNLIHCDLLQLSSEIDQCIANKSTPTSDILKNVSHREILLGAVEETVKALERLSNPDNRASQDDSNSESEDHDIGFDYVAEEEFEPGCKEQKKIICPLQSRGKATELPSLPFAAILDVRDYTVLRRYLNGELQLDGVVYPDNNKVELASFLDNPDYSVGLTLVQNKKILEISRLTPEMAEIRRLITGYAALTPAAYTSDYELIKVVLSSVDFIIEHQKTLIVEPSVVSDMISASLMPLTKLSENAKNRCVAFIYDKEWWTLELTASVLCSYFTNNDSTHSPLEYGEFRNLMLTHIVRDDLPELQKFLQLIYCMEYYMVHYKYDATVNFEIVKNNIDTVVKIFELQKTIDSKVNSATDYKVEQERQVDLIKSHNLKCEFRHIHFLCTTINNYYSLQKILGFIDQLPDKNSFATPESKEALLFVLIEIGEYLCHRKLSNKFREDYKDVPWELFQIIRDCLLHQDENGFHDVVNNLLENKIPGVTLEELLGELKSFKSVIQKILNSRFQKPNDVFVEIYVRTYENYPILPSIPWSEKEFFLSNFAVADQKSIDQWREILDNPKLLPSDNKKLGELKKIWPRDKQAKKRYQSIYTKLEDIRDDAPENILYKSEMNEFKKFDLWKKSPHKWHAILTKMKEATIDDYEDLKTLNGTEADAIVEKIGDYVGQHFFDKWLKKIIYTEIKQLFSILEDVPEIELKWQRILSSDQPYPPLQEFSSDLNLVKARLGSEDALTFVALTAKLKMSVKLPAVARLRQEFISQPKSNLSKLDAIDFLISKIMRAADICNDSINPKSIMMHTLPEINKFRSYFFGTQEGNAEPSYIRAQDLLTIVKELNIIPQSDESKELIAKFLSKIKAKLTDYNCKNSIIYNLTVAITVLKTISKYPEVSQDSDIHKGYESFKRCRNDLVHGNYVYERMQGEHYKDKIIFELCRALSTLLAAAKDLRAKFSGHIDNKFDDANDAKMESVALMGVW